MDSQLLIQQPVRSLTPALPLQTASTPCRLVTIRWGEDLSMQTCESVVSKIVVNVRKFAIFKRTVFFFLLFIRLFILRTHLTHLNQTLHLNLNKTLQFKTNYLSVVHRMVCLTMFLFSCVSVLVFKIEMCKIKCTGSLQGFSVVLCF